jgi:hypothetical protein
MDRQDRLLAYDIPTPKMPTWIIKNTFVDKIKSKQLETAKFIFKLQELA